MRIIMLMRDNALTHRGGDTVVLERLSEELLALGHKVEIDLEGKKEVSQFDIAHLLNFATAEKLQLLAKHCFKNKTKFVATTLYDDWQTFFNPMVIQELLLTAYVKNGQPAKDWAAFENTAMQAAPAEKQDNIYTALAAQILVSSGFQESVALRRDYPDCGPIETCYFGCNISSYSDSGKLFREEYKIDNFVLCVGRLEQRKNQLSLLKALEDSSVALVFAGGGFSYGESYAESCRNFKRTGKTIFLERVSPEMLTSCYEAAAVHVLPSWYELPGLASIEAAALGTPCVVTDYGTIRDYLGESAYYCIPGSTLSIRSAIDEALKTGKRNFVRPDLSRFTWANSAKRMVEIYEKALQLPLTEIDLETLVINESERKQRELADFNKMQTENPNLQNMLRMKR